MEELPEFKIAKLDLGLNDILVLKTRQHLTLDAQKRMVELLKTNVPEGQKVFVLDGDFELAVLTRAEIEARS